MKQGNIPRWTLIPAVLGVLSVFAEVDSYTQWDQVVMPAVMILLSAALVWRTLRWVDAYEPEPVSFQMWAISWGAAAGFFTLVVYSVIQVEDAQGQIAALVEESLKLIVVWLAFRRGAVNSWLDGLIYGALAGLGFTICEDLLYAGTSDEPLTITLVRLSSSVFAHSLFTGIAGGLVARGLIASSTVISSAGLFVGVLLHALWNLNASNGSLLWGLLIAMPPAIFFAAAIWYRDHERQVIQQAAVKAVSAGLIDESRALTLWDLRQRAWVMKHMPVSARSAYTAESSAWIRHLLTGHPAPILPPPPASPVSDELQP